MHKGPLFSTPWPTLISYLFDKSPSTRYEVISCDLDLHFADISDVEHLPVCLLAICMLVCLVFAAGLYELHEFFMYFDC